VWLLDGGSHHSALIALGDHLVLVDAPESEARTLAVIEQAKALVPGKPLTTLVMTHHHFDHTAGLRAAVAAGMRVITHAANTAFVEQMVARTHTIAPDTLAKAPAAVRVEHVDDVRDIGESARPVVLVHLKDNPHASAMLAVHLPKEKLLIEVDAFSPGAAVNPYAANLLEHVRGRKLQVDRIVPLHGKVVPLAELEKAVKAGTD
jgi:glyoxylase-like metal-dependent hydrolase (beta-lactamase superfamily II)